MTAGVAAGGLPTSGAFVASFWLAAAMLALAFVAALLVPHRRSALETV